MNWKKQNKNQNLCWRCSPEGGAWSHAVDVRGPIWTDGINWFWNHCGRSRWWACRSRLEVASQSMASRSLSHWPPRLTRLAFWDSSDTSSFHDRSRKCFKVWIAGVFCCVPLVLFCFVCVVPAWTLWSGSSQRGVSLWASLSGRRCPNEMQMSRFRRYGQNKTDVYIRALDSVGILEAWGRKKLWMFPRRFPVQLKASLFNFFSPSLAAVYLKLPWSQLEQNGWISWVLSPGSSSFHLQRF